MSLTSIPALFFDLLVFEKEKNNKCVKFSYINEIKNRCLLIFFSWIVSIFVCYAYKEILLFIFIKPCMFDKSSHMYFIFTNITEIFYVYISLIFFVTKQIVFFESLFHIFMFLIPAFFLHEYQKFRLIFIINLFFWFVSICFLIKILLPNSWYFFFTFQKPVNNQIINLCFEAKLFDYLKFFFQSYYFCFAICQFFVFLFLFLDYMNINHNYVKKNRKFFFLVFFLIGAILTPPDIASQAIIGACLFLFFEILVVLIFFKNFCKFRFSYSLF